MEESARLADALVASAIHTGDACTWLVARPTGAGPKETAPLPADGHLYQGTAGIALFLMEIHACTGEARYLHAAKAAMRHAERSGASGGSHALYSGRGGVAVAAARLAIITAGDEWRDLAVRQLAGIRDRIATDNALDVIGGSAGAVLATLAVGRMIDEPSLLESATALGERLIATAVRRRGGWSWQTSLISRQDLCGYAHGASGFAHAFLELFAATGEERWSFAASRAMEYETAHHVRETGDWLDLRNVALSEVLREPSGIEQVRARLRRGEPLHETPVRSMRAWCHGAPGIGLVRIRALTLGVRAEESEAEARAALAATSADLQTMHESGVSLCHGAFGNAELVLAAEQHLGIAPDLPLRDRIRELVVRRQRLGLPWPSGTLGGAEDASLLVGDAGVGLQLLRFARPEVGSALFVSDWGARPQHAVGDGSALREEIQVLLPRTWAALEGLPGTGPVRQRVTAATAGASSTTDALRAVGEALAMEDSTDVAACMRDAFLLDETLLAAQDEFTDYVAQWCREVLRPSADRLRSELGRFILAPSSRMVWSEFKWREWTKGQGVLPERGRQASVAFRMGKRVMLQPVSDAMSVVLEGLATPRTVEDAVVAAKDLFDDDHAVAEALPTFVRSVMAQALGAGVIDLLPDRVEAA